jgi:adenine/guanine phosphoribosyltransferase-like PRPP-binding protein
VQVFGHRRKAHIDHVHELADNADEYIHVDGDFFRGRKVIVLDDIVTTCKTANAFIDRMVSAGADVSMVLFLAKTKQFFACAQQHVKRKSN